MIDPAEVERLGLGLAQALARYSTRDLRKILEFAFENRVKGGAMPRQARLLEDFAEKIKSPIMPPRRRQSSNTIPISANGDR